MVIKSANYEIKYNNFPLPTDLHARGAILLDGVLPGSSSNVHDASDIKPPTSRFPCIQIHRTSHHHAPVRRSRSILS